MQPIPTPITELVDALLAAGCNMWALGDGYVIGEPQEEPQAGNVALILAAFGPRDHALEPIARYLRQLGRDLDDSG